MKYLINKLAQIKQWILSIVIWRFLDMFSRKNDPLYSCELYKNEGCSHIDGMLCDFPECSMNKEYMERNAI